MLTMIDIAHNKELCVSIHRMQFHCFVKFIVMENNHLRRKSIDFDPTKSYDKWKCYARPKWLPPLKVDNAFEHNNWVELFTG